MAFADYKVKDFFLNYKILNQESALFNHFLPFSSGGAIPKLSF